MPTSVHKRFSDAINVALKRSELKRIVEFDLGVQYENVVSHGGTYNEECDDVILWAEKHNRLEELRLAAYAANPDNQTLLAFVKSVDVGFVEAHKKAADLAKSQSDAEAAISMASLPPATGLQASIVASSLGQQTISLDLAIKRQLEARRRICVIEVPGRSIGTGFLIGPRLIMTNRHVFDAALSLNPPDIRAVFDYSGDQSYESLPRKKIVLTPVAMSEVNDLDYAVLKMAPDQETSDEPDRGFFTVCPDRLGDKSSITIMGHPAKGTTALGIQYSWGMIRDINDQSKRIAYTAQTGPGSSGSPVFNADFELVGLHHHGQDGVNNHGIPIWAIAESLKLQGLTELVTRSHSTPFGQAKGEIESAQVHGKSMADVPIHRVEHVILMLHGIRDFASGWQNVAKRILEEDGNGRVHAVGVRFGYYDVLSFIAPVDLSRGPYEKVLSAYEKAVQAYPNSRISLVAHSYGTYLVGRLLRDNAAVRIHRILFCGAVISEDYSLEEVVSRFATADIEHRCRILNECGTSDKWPIYAKAISNRYGDAGRHGLNDDIYSTSVFFNGGHSLFFTETHIRTTWKPFLIDGRVPQSNDQAPKAILREQLLSLPFMRGFFRMLVTCLWAILYFWPITILAIAYGVLVAGNPWPPRGKAAVLRTYAEELRSKAKILSAPELGEYHSFLTSAPEATLEFDAAITFIETTAAEQGRVLYLAPLDCDGMRSDKKTFQALFPEESLPEDTNVSALAPSNGEYRTVHVIARVDSILWNPGEKKGLVMLIGIDLTLKPLKMNCPENE